jgi:hypothetical protein
MGRTEVGFGALAFEAGSYATRQWRSRSGAHDDVKTPAGVIAILVVVVLVLQLLLLLLLKRPWKWAQGKERRKKQLYLHAPTTHRTLLHTWQAAIIQYDIAAKWAVHAWLTLNVGNKGRPARRIVGCLLFAGKRIDVVPVGRLDTRATSKISYRG